MEKEKELIKENVLFKISDIDLTNRRRPTTSMHEVTINAIKSITNVELSMKVEKIILKNKDIDEITLKNAFIYWGELNDYLLLEYANSLLKESFF